MQGEFYCVSATHHANEGIVEVRVLGELSPLQQQALLSELENGLTESLVIEPQVDSQLLTALAGLRIIEEKAEVDQGYRGIETALIFTPDPVQNLNLWKSRDRFQKETARNIDYDAHLIPYSDI